MKIYKKCSEKNLKRNEKGKKENVDYKTTRSSHPCLAYMSDIRWVQKTKVTNWKGALSNPIPFVKRSSEQFLFLLKLIWKALPGHSLSTIVNSNSKISPNQFLAIKFVWSVLQ